MAEAYIVAVGRTAGGRRDGKLKEWHPADLAGKVIDELLDRSGADPEMVEDVIMELRHPSRVSKPPTSVVMRSCHRGCRKACRPHRSTANAVRRNNQFTLRRRP